MPIKNTLRRGEFGIVHKEGNLIIEKVDNGEGISGYLVKNTKTGKERIPDDASFRKAVKIFKAEVKKANR